MTLGIAGESSRRREELLVNREYNQNQKNDVHTDTDIQNPGTPQEIDLQMGDDHPFDISVGVDPCESYSNETDTSTGQSPLQQPGPSGPPDSISSMFVFQPASEEPGTESQDSGDDESDGDGANGTVTFDPDIEPGTPMVEYGYQIENPLLHIMEEARQLDQMRHMIMNRRMIWTFNPCNNPPPKSDVIYRCFYLFLFKT